MVDSQRPTRMNYGPNVYRVRCVSGCVTIWLVVQEVQSLCSEFFFFIFILSICIETSQADAIYLARKFMHKDRSVQDFKSISLVYL